MSLQSFIGRKTVTSALECRLLCPELIDQVTRFFQRVSSSGVAQYFHPHPFTPEEAESRTRYTGADLYYALLVDGEMAAYGMLRGWDEGYEVPSLGIAVDPRWQGKGYGRLLMTFLHAAARARGARQIRLKVYEDNARALALYRSLGYQFGGERGSQKIGVVELTHRDVKASD